MNFYFHKRGLLMLHDRHAPLHPPNGAGMIESMCAVHATELASQRGHTQVRRIQEGAGVVCV